MLRALAKEGFATQTDFMVLYHTLHHAQGLFAHVQRHLPDVLEQKPVAKAGLQHFLEVPVAKGWWQELQRCFTPEGEWRESASPRFAQLHRRARSQRDEIQTTLQDMLKNPALQTALQDRVIVQRNGRYTLPVNVYYKNSVPGIVHDASGTGATVFIEPRRVVELSNRLRETELETEAEMERILKSLSEGFHPHASELLRYVDALSRLERLWAAALLARELDAYPIHILPEHAPVTLNLKQLKHPLLCLQQRHHDIVGSDVTLGHALNHPARCMIITGPNTGGKTVLLKSIGLANVMMQAGLLLAVQESSKASLFTSVLADIGDAQSLQNNLSTFSGQMTRLARFAHPTVPLERTLVLLDEIASGTDPVEGTALARALLRRFYEKGATTICTTHLGVLKQEAYSMEGYINASVAFDIERLAPTYQLVIGLPGASNAITIARRLGLDEAVLDQAEQFMGQSEVDASTLLTRLEQEQQASTGALEQAQQLKQEWEQRTREMKEEQQQFREKKKQLLVDYQAQFRARLRQFEEQAKRLKKELKQAETQPDALRFARQRVARLAEKTEEAFHSEMTPLEAELVAHTPEKETHVFRVGDAVRHPRLNAKTEVMAISADGKKITVKSGGISLVVSPEELEPAGLDAKSMLALKRAEKREILKRIQQQPREAVQERQLPKGRMAFECDVRGKRAAEAIEEVQAFLDNAHMVGLNTVGIIHGLGTGALKKAVRDYLKTNPFVQDYYPEQAHLGGDGKTIVEVR
jgi:DNA mismatch repair protein MutS2